MVQQVEEVTIESERHPFIDFEGLADTKINVREHRARNRTTGKVGIAPEAAMGIDVNTRIRQARGCRHKLALIQVLVHRLTGVRIDQLLSPNRVQHATRTDEIWSIDTDTILVGITRAVKQSNWGARIPRDDAIHRPASNPAITMEERQVI